MHPWVHDGYIICPQILWDSSQNMGPNSHLEYGLDIDLLLKSVINVIRHDYKCRKWELHLKLSDQKLKTLVCVYMCAYIYTHIYVYLYTRTHIYLYTHTHTHKLLNHDFMGNANQKTTTDTHTHTHTKSNSNTTLKMVIKPKRTKEEGKKKTPTKPNPKQLRKWH